MLRVVSRMMLLSVVGVSLGLAAETRAELIKASFSGTINNVAPNGSMFNVGGSFSGFFIYDSSVGPREVDPDATAFDAVQSVSFTINGVTVTPTGPAELQIDDNNGPSALTDRFALVQGTNSFAPVLGIYAFNGLILRFDDESNSIFSSTNALPTSLSLSDFTSRTFFLTVINPDNGDDNQSADGTITAFSTGPVPEPANVALLGVAVPVMLARRRR